MTPLLQAGAVATAVLAILGLLAVGARLVIWVKGLDTLVQHELRPNSGSSIKDAQAHQLEALKRIEERQREDRKWQLSVTEKLGNHDGRLAVLEKK